MGDPKWLLKLHSVTLSSILGQSGKTTAFHIFIYNGFQISSHRIYIEGCLTFIPSSFIRSRRKHHFDYCVCFHATGRYLIKPLIKTCQKVDVVFLACTTTLVCALHVEVRQALMSLHKC